MYCMPSAFVSVWYLSVLCLSVLKCKLAGRRHEDLLHVMWNLVFVRAHHNACSHAVPLFALALC